MTDTAKTIACGTRRNLAYTLTIVLSLAMTAGCRTSGSAASPPNNYYICPQQDLARIGRTALIELDNASTYPQISAEVTESLFRAIQKTNVFGISTFRPNEPRWRSLNIDPDGTYTLSQLSQMRNTLKCNAVLAGTVTSYRPYPHMAIALKLKLIDLTDGQLLWAIEQVWDATDKNTEKRIKAYFHEQIRSGYTPLGEQLVVVSSLEFTKFVAYEVARTIGPKK